MSALADLQQFIIAAPALAAVVKDRVYPLLAEPGDVLPFIVYTKVSDTSIETHDGASGLDSIHVQFSCYAKSYEAADTLRGLLKTLLQGYTGTLTPGTTFVGNISYVTGRETFESTTRVYCSMIEFTVWHSLSTTNP
jgi:hypothetical protein